MKRHEGDSDTSLARIGAQPDGYRSRRHDAPVKTSAHRFSTRGAFDPARSVLGRRLSRTLGPLRGEAKFYFTAVMIFVVLLIANFFAWGFLWQHVLTEPLGPVTIVFSIAQFGVLAAFVSFCVIGRRPPVHVAVSREAIIVEQGLHLRRLERRDIETVEVVPAVIFHRHYRRYSRVRSFVGAASSEHVIIRAGDDVIAIGIDGVEARRMVAELQPTEQTAATQEIRLAR